MLSDDEVSETVKKCYPHIYNYTIVKTMEEDVQPAEAPALPVPEPQGAKEDAVPMEVAKEDAPAMDMKESSSPIPATSSSGATTASTKVTCDDKKRKRITPTMIGKVGDNPPTSKLDSPSPTIVDIEVCRFLL